jgi:hypothetical protein
LNHSFESFLKVIISTFFIGIQKRTDKSPRACSVIDHKIIIEVNGVEITFDGKICSVWNRVAVCRYLSMLTSLKIFDFRIWVNGVEWEDKWSFGAKKAIIIKAVPAVKVMVYFMNLFSYEDVNVQSLMFRNNEVSKSFICQRNFTLGRAIAMWNLYDLDFPPFDNWMVNGRKV